MTVILGDRIQIGILLQARPAERHYGSKTGALLPRNREKMKYIFRSRAKFDRRCNF